MCVLLLTLGLVLIAAEDKTTKKSEAKTESISPLAETQKSSNTQKATELKQEKRGVHGEEEGQGPSQGRGEEGGGQAGQETEVTHHRPLVIEKVVHIHVPVPHPYPVEYVKHVPYPLKVPVPVVIHKPFPVSVPKPYHVVVEKKEPYSVVRHVPYSVPVPVKVPVKVPVEVPAPKPYSSTASLPLPQPVINPVPLYTKQHPESQENHKPEGYKDTQYKDSVPASHNAKIYNIPEIQPETYKEIVPGTTYKLSEIHQHLDLPRYHQLRIPEEYFRELQPAVNSHEFSIFGGHGGDSSAGLVNHGQEAEGHRSNYQSFSNC